MFFVFSDPASATQTSSPTIPSPKASRKLVNNRAARGGHFDRNSRSKTSTSTRVLGLVVSCCSVTAKVIGRPPVTEASSPTRALRGNALLPRQCAKSAAIGKEFRL